MKRDCEAVLTARRGKLADKVSNFLDKGDWCFNVRLSVTMLTCAASRQVGVNEQITANVPFLAMSV